MFIVSRRLLDPRLGCRSFVAGDRRPDHERREREHRGEDRQGDGRRPPGAEAAIEPEQKRNRGGETNRREEHRATRACEQRRPGQRPDVVEHVRQQLLEARHPDLGKKVIRLVVDVADALRRNPELGAGLSVRATDEACIYLKHPLIASDRAALLPEVLKSSFCGRYGGRWNDVGSDAGAAWAVIQNALREHSHQA